MKSNADKKADERAALSKISRERSSPFSGVGLLGAGIILGPFLPLLPNTIFGFDKLLIQFAVILVSTFILTKIWRRYLNTKPADSVWQWLK